MNRLFLYIFCHPSMKNWNRIYNTGICEDKKSNWIRKSIYFRNIIFKRYIICTHRINLPMAKSKVRGCVCGRFPAPNRCLVHPSGRCPTIDTCPEKLIYWLGNSKTVDIILIKINKLYNGMKFKNLSIL